MISVIIPTYNRAHLISFALDSVRRQTCRDYEIIVVDDGSTDNTQQLLAPMKDVRYTRIANRGPSAVRNIGIGQARGEFIAFLDSDDIWEPSKLERQLEAFRRSPKCGLVASNYRFIDGKGAAVRDPGAAFGYVPDEFFVRDLLKVRFPFGATSAFMVRQDVFKEIGAFNEKLRISEDLDLLTRIGLRYKVGYVDEVLVSVRLHDNHLMRETPRYQVWLDSVSVLEAHYAAIRLRVPEVRQYYAGFYGRAGNSALLSGRRGTAFRIYMQALKNSPFHPKVYKDLVRCALPMSYLKARYDQTQNKSLHAVFQQYS